MCLGVISKYFTADKLKQPEFNRYVYDFSVDDNSIKVTTTVKICKYLMKKKKLFRLFKQVFIAILSFSGSLGTTCISLTNQACNRNTFT